MITINKYNNYIKNINKTYSEKFSTIRILTVIFSIFGHITSIFFAFFFFKDLFSSSAFSVSGLWVTIGIIFCLSIFELLKRYVFDLFCIQYTNQRKILGKGKLSFLIITFIIISSSFLFSLSGARTFVNNDNKINVKNETSINQKTDSLKREYNVLISPLISENKISVDQKTELINQQNIYINSGKNVSKINEQIKQINIQINNNKNKISSYENKRDIELKIISDKSNKKLYNDISNNNLSIVYFLIFCSLIELIILSGVYYNRLYQYKSFKEYEDSVVNTLNYKNWKAYNMIIDIIFSKGDIKINEQIPAASSILEIIDFKNIEISKKELDNCFKILSYLKICETNGKRRILKVTKENSKTLLNEYFNIK